MFFMCNKTSRASTRKKIKYKSRALKAMRKKMPIAFLEFIKHKAVFLIKRQRARKAKFAHKRIAKFFVQQNIINPILLNCSAQRNAKKRAIFIGKTAKRFLRNWITNTAHKPAH